MQFTSAIVRRNVAAVRPSMARTLTASARVMKSNPNYEAGVPIPTGDSASGQRDLVGEQVNRIGEPAPMSLVSDAPNSLHQRMVRVFQPAKSATTSGKAGTRDWRVDFDVLQGSGRWESPLMGWASTMKFDTKEDAIHFCQKQGWDYLVQEPHKARIPPKTYADNYKYVPGKLRIHHTK